MVLVEDHADRDPALPGGANGIQQGLGRPALEAEVADLGDRLETRKSVERAKGVLMKKLKIGEADAFRWIQKTAMDRRMGMREVADAVVEQMGSA